MALKTRWYFLIGALAGMLGAVAWVLSRAPRSTPQAAPAVVGTELFQSVFSYVRNAAVDSLTDQELYRRAAAGVIDELDDPYAVLLLPGQRLPPSDEIPAPQGLYLDRRDGAVVVVATIPGSTGDVAGVHRGDRVIGIDSTPVDPTRMDQVLRLLDGAAGSKVTLRVRRDGTRPTLAFEVTRGPLPASGAAEGSSLSGGVGRVLIRRFPSGIVDSVRRAIEALRASGARSLVLDVRGAVGGTLDQGAGLADLFLDPGIAIAQTRGRQATASRSITDSTPSPFDSLPLAVLVDGGTAGAGEVVAGALQDHDRAAVLGSTTFGRGVTQSSYALGGGVTLRLTTSLWITPGGRQIQRPPRSADGDSVSRPRLKSDGGRVLLGGGGIVPDRTVSDTGTTDLALAQARDILAKAGSTRAVLALLASR